MRTLDPHFDAAMADNVLHFYHQVLCKARHARALDSFPRQRFSRVNPAPEGAKAQPQHACLIAPKVIHKPEQDGVVDFSQSNRCLSHFSAYQVSTYGLDAVGLVYGPEPYICPAFVTTDVLECGHVISPLFTEWKWEGGKMIDLGVTAKRRRCGECAEALKIPSVVAKTNWSNATATMAYEPTLAGNGRISQEIMGNLGSQPRTGPMRVEIGVSRSALRSGCKPRNDFREPVRQPADVAGCDQLSACSSLNFKLYRDCIEAISTGRKKGSATEPGLGAAPKGRTA